MESDATAEMKLQVCEVITPPFTVKKWKNGNYICLVVTLDFSVFFSWILVKGHMVSCESAVLIIWWFCPSCRTSVGLSERGMDD